MAQHAWRSRYRPALLGFTLDVHDTYIHAHSYIDGCSIHAPHVCVRMRARACAMARPRIRADTCERLPVGVDRRWLGAQAFRSASAFNANIGAWNTARVTDLSWVCAAFRPGVRHRGRPRVRFSCA